MVRVAVPLVAIVTVVVLIWGEKPKSPRCATLTVTARADFGAGMARRLKVIVSP